MAVHAAAASPFVTANGTQLDLNGRPWDFTGYDAYQATSVSNGFNCGGSYSDQQLNTLFAQMRTNSASTVVRTWFFQSYGGPNNWSQYDRVLNAAAANGLRVIPALVKQWGDCEPWPNGVRPYRTLAWYQSGYTQTATATRFLPRLRGGNGGALCKQSDDRLLAAGERGRGEGQRKRCLRELASSDGDAWLCR